MQGYEGVADWSLIQAVKEAIQIPVIGNGDIRLPVDALRMMRETGCDGVMIGRAASSNPWIFRQIEQLVTTGKFDEPSEGDRYRLLSRYFHHLAESGFPDAIGKMKQFACWFTHGVRNGAELRRQVHHSRTPTEILERVESFFAGTLVSEHAG
jgi:tRNA-dihydrouridine synthase